MFKTILTPIDNKCVSHGCRNVQMRANPNFPGGAYKRSQFCHEHESNVDWVLCKCCNNPKDWGDEPCNKCKGI